MSMVISSPTEIEKHTPYSLQDFEVGILKTSASENSGDIDNSAHSGECNVNSDSDMETKTKEHDYRTEIRISFFKT